MHPLSLPQLCQNACQITRQVGQFIQQELGKVVAQDIEVKGLNSLVSYVDKSAEEQLVQGLQKLLPQATFLTEEETIATQEGEYQWIIDPLDGTTNFLHQIPFFAISIGLQYRQETIIGIVYEVNRQECFYAWKNGGAYLNNRPISTSSNTQLSEALIATGFPYYDYTRAKAYFQLLEQLAQNTRGIRRLGAAALDLAYVACGRFDAFFEYSLSPWDVAGGALLVQEAGGQVCDFQKGDNYIFGKEIIASSTPLSTELIATICNYLK